MKILYTAHATADEEGRTGHTRTDDGKVDFDLTSPKELGDDGGPDTNPGPSPPATRPASPTPLPPPRGARAPATDVKGVTVTAHVDFGALGKGASG